MSRKTKITGEDPLKGENDMEEKKLNELNDEALDVVTGGATFEKDKDSGWYIVRDADGKEVQRFSHYNSAKRLAEHLSEEERTGVDSTPMQSRVGGSPRR